jgi:4-amino-4-deoxy-L-arabinose transferase-like glycosyltransferase
MPVMWSRGGAAALLLALAVWGFTYRLGAAPLLDDPNDAEYAEVAREMVETGDWASPHLNYVLFLNKPPLAYWTIGVSYLGFGVSEYAARLPSALVGVAIVLLLAWVGSQLYDVETGLLAGFVLTASGGFFFETHEVRPDLLLTLGVVGSLAAFVRLQRAAPERMRGPLLGLQVSLAVGLLAKGMLAVVLPGLVFLVMIISERRFDLIPRLLHPRAWWLLVLLIAPWHVAMSLLHPGFLWDYVVNQHFLFFFDRKFPRDSEPVSLAVFWAAFALRLFPWTLFVPLAAWMAASRVRQGEEAYGDRFTLAWVGTVLLFFSAASSRMEHYSIPALPAATLLVAKLLRDYAGKARSALSRAVTAHVVVFGAIALTGPFVVPDIVATQTWLAHVHEFVPLARTTFAIFAAGGLAAAAAALAGRRAWVAAPIVAAFAVSIPCLQQGLSLVARINSSAGMAAALQALVTPEDRLVYEAPVEYQNCAGFNFYLRRKLDVLRPAQFVPSPYLAPHVDDLFLSRDQFTQLWQTECVFFISDPLQSRSSLHGVVPQPFYIVARDSARWVVTNQPLH